MNTELLDIVRTANREFRGLIEEISQDGPKFLKSRGALRRLERLSLRLSQVDRGLAESLRSASKEAQSEYEVLKYRENLKALRGVFETLQYSLLVEKSHLDNVRANLQSANAWATSLREPA
jgi:hypothetical protein